MAARNDLAKRQRTRVKRRQGGQAVTVLMIFMATFVVAPIVLVCYEMCLYNFAKQQLKACLDSAALAAGATVATSDNLDPTGTQVGAKTTAMNMFKMNSILSNSMSTVTESSSPTMNPPAGQAQLYFQFLDPVTRAAVPLGSTNGKIIQVSGAYGFTPMFAKFLKLPTNVTAYEMSNGGLPMLDVVLCFDISASMDDFSLISVVDRYLLSTKNSAGIVVKTSAAYNILGKGPLYTAFKCTNPTGTPLNATFPQELDGGGGAWSFSKALRGVNCGGMPPQPISNTSFSDLVVNIDGTSDFSKGTTINGCVFPAGNVGLLVEASRGNFESILTATAAGVDYSSWGVVPKAGYYAAYQQAAMAQRHPISDAIIAAQNFFTIMNNDCDAHFSLVSFGSDPGVKSTQVVDPDYATLGNITDNPATYVSNLFPLDPMVPLPPNPGIVLNPAAGPSNSNYSSVMNAVQTLVAYGGTNIAGALQTSINQFNPTSSGGQGLARAGAKKAIVLFTDGLPTVSSLGGDPTADARAQAVAANTAGIPIYCIGLCLVPSLQASQTAVLNDTNSNQSTGGLAAISGNNAQFYQATDTTQLNQVFENVARALVNLIR